MFNKLRHTAVFKHAYAWRLQTPLSPNHSSCCATDSPSSSFNSLFGAFAQAESSKLNECPERGATEAQVLERRYMEKEASTSYTPALKQPRLPKGLSKLHVHVMQVTRSKDLLKPNDHILIAVSGGQDSLCLAQILKDLARSRSWKLQVAHCDHRWRADSEANAIHVAGLSKLWGLPYHLCTAPEPPPSTEAAARTWRYEALAKLATCLGCNVVVTGHTATDRAETLLVNLIRGAGADGMQALAWSRPLEGAGVNLVRPLLTVSREQTLELCLRHGLEIWEDSTNADNKYRRNRIRNELMPYLRLHFNPRTDEALARTAEVLQDEVIFLEEAAAQLLAMSLVDETECVPTLSNILLPSIQSTAHSVGPRYSYSCSAGDMAVPLVPHLTYEAVDQPRSTTLKEKRNRCTAKEESKALKQRSLSLQVLHAAPPALQRRALRQLMSILVPGVAHTHSSIDEVMQLIASSRSGQSGSTGGGTATGSLPSGMRAWVESGCLVLEVEHVHKKAEEQSVR
ncbi:hypothetical protein CEUSTIGMA_g5373.t1 [Chlamydomonas eustigma]|uniref:tRNA(Ile)-lysidine synthetase n=1 Tax=Chlamydomonas eustigma TaxID=1157962 RepID=A0A250X4E1_9CHLO|nr:hypothetical protein CEUSTIGMA_g5373.t1 [Chlamydomonas eustigma]|eukprot:GAX77931.1 hypothetical protein CEUSTIGMA_g5373.t1 [Chlamydomonas eustigma]